jgi:hypothetical protein
MAECHLCYRQITNRSDHARWCSFSRHETLRVWSEGALRIAGALIAFWGLVALLRFFWQYS